LWLFMLGATALAAQGPAEDKLLGTWTGSWEGMGASGGFELTLEKSKEGPVTGKVSVTGEPTYNTAVKTLAFEGQKMNAKYDFPPDERAEVVLTASFEGNKATGTWVLREKGTENQVANGTWTVAKKS
jgi:hypothetical protein